MNILVLTVDRSPHNGWGRYSRDVIAVLSARGDHVHVVAHAGDETTESISLPFSTNYIRAYLLAPWYAWKLRSVAKECDVIHCFIEQYSFLGYVLSKMSGVPYVVTAHGTYGLLPYAFSFITRYVHHLSFKNAKRVICVSSYTKRLLDEKGLSNTVAIPNGIEAFELWRGDDVREEMILSVGALKHRKGQFIALQAFASIAEKFPSLRYVLVSGDEDPEYRKKMDRVVSENNLKDRVVFLSKISDEEKDALYAKAKVFVLPTISKGAHFEGFGLVYLEANAFGVPGIGTYNSGAEDAIRDGKTGFLVPQEDVGAVAGAITKLLEGDVWKQMSTSSRAWALENTWEKRIEEYGKIYAQV